MSGVKRIVLKNNKGKAQPTNEQLKAAGTNNKKPVKK